MLYRKLLVHGNAPTRMPKAFLLRKPLGLRLFTIQPQVVQERTYILSATMAGIVDVCGGFVEICKVCAGAYRKVLSLLFHWQGRDGKS